MRFKNLQVRSLVCDTRVLLVASPPNEGQVNIVHRDPHGKSYDVCFQHAKVHCPRISVTDVVFKGCTATVHKHGGHIGYYDGRRLRFVRRGGVFVVLLHVESPVFSRHG